jgi:cbb3-type cytochrome oxidase maturation protein
VHYGRRQNGTRARSRRLGAPPHAPWWFWNLFGEQAVFLPLALGLGLLGLGAFLWSLKTGQYDDLEGAAWRAVMDDDALGNAGGE